MACVIEVYLGSLLLGASTMSLSWESFLAAAVPPLLLFVPALSRGRGRGRRRETTTTSSLDGWTGAR